MIDGGDLRRCRQLLPRVSRTFALSIRVLPSSLRDPVTVSYLLCRMADTLEDATWCDPGMRLEGLRTLAGLVASCADPARMAASFPGPSAPAWMRDAEDVAFPAPGGPASARSVCPAGLPPEQDPAEAELMRHRLAVFRAFCNLPRRDREIAGRWISALALGMSAAVEREAQASGPFVLESLDELRRYSWCVAGTIGLLLTELFTTHLGTRIADPQGLLDRAVSFGLGLQFTNILQDLAEDRRRGWSYFPEELARRHGTSVQAFQDPAQRRHALRAVGDLVLEAASCLDRAFEYTLLLPRRAAGVRLFCLWPILFALRTLVRIWGEERIVIGGEKVRISRSEVRTLIARTVALCPFDRGLRNLYTRERRRLRERIRGESLA